MQKRLRIKDYVSIASMDALASLAFGIVVIQVVRNLGVENPKNIAFSTVKSGVFSMSLMAIIYTSLEVISRSYLLC